MDDAAADDDDDGIVVTTTTPPSPRRYDAIIIGSGMGAMTTAVALSREHHMRVLLLEQASKLGGLTQCFSRKKGKYCYDVGVHYVGRMGEGEVERKMMDYVTGGGVEWCPMPDKFDKMVFPRYSDEVVMVVVVLVVMRGGVPTLCCSCRKEGGNKRGVEGGLSCLYYPSISPY